MVDGNTTVGKMYHRLMGENLDLKGACQEKNLKGVCTALWLLEENFKMAGAMENVCNAAAITCLRGRWETLCNEPLTICDTGHNSHGFKVLGPQIKATAAKQKALYPQSRFYMVFGVVADKDLEAVVEYLPKEAYYYFVNARGTRALPAKDLAVRMQEYGFKGEAVDTDIATFLKGFTPAKEDFTFIGGSTFVVAEALEI